MKMKWDNSKEAEILRFKYPFGDKDKDNVPNIIDCQPFNPDKDGIREFLTSVGQRVTGAVSTATTAVKTRMAAVKPAIKRYAEIASKPSSLSGLYIHEIRKKHKEPKPAEKSIVSGYETVFVPARTHFKMVSETMRKPEQFYETKVIEPVTTTIMGKPKISPEVISWEQKWKPYIKGKEFTGTEAQFEEFQRGLNKYYKKTGENQYVLREQYVIKPNLLRQTAAGIAAGALYLPIWRFSVGRVATGAIAEPRAFPGEAISYGKEMIGLAKTYPGYFTGSLIGMGAGSYIGIKTSPSYIKGIEISPEGAIRSYKGLGIGETRRPVIGIFKETLKTPEVSAAQRALVLGEDYPALRYLRSVETIQFKTPWMGRGAGGWRTITTKEIGIGRATKIETKKGEALWGRDVFLGEIKKPPITPEYKALPETTTRAITLWKRGKDVSLAKRPTEIEVYEPPDIKEIVPRGIRIEARKIPTYTELIPGRLYKAEVGYKAFQIGKYPKHIKIIGLAKPRKPSLGTRGIIYPPKEVGGVTPLSPLTGKLSLRQLPPAMERYIRKIEAKMGMFIREEPKIVGMTEQWEIPIGEGIPKWKGWVFKKAKKRTVDFWARVGGEIVTKPIEEPKVTILGFKMDLTKPTKGARKKIISYGEKWRKEEEELLKGEGIKSRYSTGQVILQTKKTRQKAKTKQVLLQRAEEQTKRIEKASSEVLGIKKEVKGRQRQKGVQRERERRKEYEKGFVISLTPRTAGIWQPSIPKVRRRRRFVPIFVPGLTPEAPGLGPIEVIKEKEKEKEEEREKQRELIIPVPIERWTPPEITIEKTITKEISKPKIPEPEIPKYPTVTTRRKPPTKKPKKHPYPKPPSKKAKKRRAEYKKEWGKYYRIAPIAKPEEILSGSLKLLGGRR